MLSCTALVRLGAGLLAVASLSACELRWDDPELREALEWRRQFAAEHPAEADALLDQCRPRGRTGRIGVRRDVILATVACMRKRRESGADARQPA